MNADLFVFTANADPLLLASASYFAVSLHSYILDPWPGYVQGKIRAGLNFLESNHNGARYSMWVDGSDSLILQPASEILTRAGNVWREAGAYGSLLFSSEHNCWPNSTLAPFYPRSAGNRFLNSGGFIAETAELIRGMKMALKMAEGFTEDDQLAWTRVLIRNEAHITLDIDRRVFSCEGDGEEAARSNPCVRHFNGRTPGREECFAKFCV